MIENSETNDFKLNFFIVAYWHDPGWRKFAGPMVKIRDLAANLTELGHEVTLFVPQYGFDPDELPCRMIRIPVMDLPLIRRMCFDFLLLMLMLYEAFLHKPHVVYVRRMGSVVPLVVAALTGARMFYEVNDDPYSSRGDTDRKVIRTIRHWLSIWVDHLNIRRSTRTFVILRELICRIRDHLPDIDPKKLVFMPSGANVDLFRPMDKMRCRTHLNLEPDDVWVGFVGTLYPHHGVDVLVEAASGIVTEFPTCRFVVIGLGPAKSDLELLVKKEGLADRWLFTGQVDYPDLPLWINAMDVCVAPYRMDTGLGSPVKIFDYLACGKPVVASNIEGTTDIFQNNEAVILVPPEHPRALGNGICKWLRNSGQAEKMGTKGRAFVVSQYDRKSLSRKIVREAMATLSTPAITIAPLSARQLTIVHVIDSGGVGGGERYLMDLMRHSRLDHVAVIPDDGPLAHQMTRMGLPHEILNMKWHGIIEAVVGLAKIVIQNHAHIIHTHGYRANFIGRLAGWITNARVVSTVHVSLMDYEETTHWLRRIYLRVEQRMAFQTDVFIAISRAMYQDLLAMGIPKERMRLIPNGVDTHRFHPRNSTKKDKWIGRLGLTGPGPIIGTVGRMVPEKGQIHLIRALKYLVPIFPEIKCLFIGNGPLKSQLQQEARRLQIESHCLFPGVVEEIETVYPVLDLFALPSRREPFGLVLLEAMASGVPVIATKSGGPLDIIQPGIHGALVPPNNAFALAKEIQFMLQNPELARQIGIQGQDRVFRHYAIDGMVQNVEAVYRQLGN